MVFPPLTSDRPTQPSERRGRDLTSLHSSSRSLRLAAPTALQDAREPLAVTSPIAGSAVARGALRAGSEALGSLVISIPLPSAFLSVCVLPARSPQARIMLDMEGSPIGLVAGLVYLLIIVG